MHTCTSHNSWLHPHHSTTVHVNSNTTEAHINLGSLSVHQPCPPSCIDTYTNIHTAPLPSEGGLLVTVVAGRCRCTCRLRCLLAFQLLTVAPQQSQHTPTPTTPTMHPTLTPADQHTSGDVHRAPWGQHTPRAWWYQPLLCALLRHGPLLCTLCDKAEGKPATCVQAVQHCGHTGVADVQWSLHELPTSSLAAQHSTA